MATPQDVISPITISMYERGAVDSAYNTSPFLGILKTQGKVKTASGHNLYWTQAVANYEVTSAGDYADVSAKYVPHQLHESFQLDWGQIESFDALSKLSIKKNKGDEALVTFRDEAVPRMFRSVLTQSTNSLAYQFFNEDGTSASLALPMYGLPAIFKFQSATTSDKEATVTSSATYAGKSLEKNGLGIDNADTYAHTPRGINTNYDWDGDSSADGELTKTNLPFVFGYAQNRITFDPADPEQKPDCFISDKLYFDTAREWIGDQQTIFISKEDDGAGKWGLGNSIEMIRVHGLPLYWDANQKASTASCLNFNQIELCYLDPMASVSGDKYPGSMKGNAKRDEVGNLLDTEINYNDSRRGITVSTTLAGQIKINARFQAEIKKRT